jgi:hypothetical protein
MLRVTQPDLTIGTQVEWTSQAAGSTKTKRGKIVAVVPAHQDPSNEIVRLRDAHRAASSNLGGGGPRGYESFLVLVSGSTERSRPHLYWPLPANLRVRD